MNITPDHADRMKQAATPGPWAHDEVPGPGEDPTRATEVYQKDEYGVIAYVQPSAADVELIAAAPDLAETIAGMTERWAVQHQEGETWHYVHSWRKSLSEAEWDLQKNKGWSPDSTFRIVRRLVSAPEVVEGE